jgi:hypothetical protein
MKTPFFVCVKRSKCGRNNEKQRITANKRNLQARELLKLGTTRFKAKNKK